MENVLAQSLQIIKDQFSNGIEIRPGDTYEYHFGFTTPAPDTENLVALAIWEFQRDTYKVPEDFSDRWEMTVSIYQKIKITSSVDEVLALLKSLCFYLETQARRPTSKGVFGKSEDGTITLSMTGRDLKYDQFFEERVLSKVRPAISDLEQLKSLIPAQANLVPVPNSLVHTLSVRQKMLIYCYELRDVIKKGEVGYNDYINLATPRKRLASARTENMAKYLIKDIEVIIPHLSKKAAQQANNEIVTLESRKEY